MYLDATPPLGREKAGEDPPSTCPLVAMLSALATDLADGGSPPADATVADVLADVLRRSCGDLPGRSAASVVAGSRALRSAASTALTTVATTADLAGAADRCQLAAGSGPTIEACRQPVHVGGIELRRRWPEAGAQLGRLGVTTVLALPLPGLAGRAVLSLYADSPFPMELLGRADETAAVAAVALAAFEVRERAANLEIALATSRQIAAAVGIVMARERCSYDDAFQLIRAISQRTHRKMRELAEHIVLTGAVPEIRGSAAPGG